MASADQRMRLLYGIWHTSNDTLDLVFQSDEAPPLPPGDGPWLGGAGTRMIASGLPVKKATVQAPTCWTPSGTAPDGSPTYTQYTWNATTSTWGSPKPCDSAGRAL